ncbi:MAG: hypothetical protein JKY04_04370, partial [Sneathiella sp.]|nr:hypothetical protein [Sneathiella sp.]
MLDYALEQLVDGVSLPGILLVTLPLCLIYRWVTARQKLFYLNVIFLIIMSLPVSGKLLLVPIDMGTPFEAVKPEDLRGKIDAIAIIASGAITDDHSSAISPSRASIFRLRRAE